MGNHRQYGNLFTNFEPGVGVVFREAIHSYFATQICRIADNISSQMSTIKY